MALRSRILAGLVASVGLTACAIVPVTPWVQFNAYSVPYNDPEQFKTMLTQWKNNPNSMIWTVKLKSSTFADQELNLASIGPCSLGPLLPTTNAAGQSNSFTPTATELKRLADRLLDSGVFTLYDGHYAAYLQGGGQGGPELTITVGTLVKHVSKDENLSPSISRESSIIGQAAEAAADLALTYVKK